MRKCGKWPRLIGWVNQQVGDMEDRLKILLLPVIPRGKNAILEIRPASGGDEPVYCRWPFRLYSKFSEQKGWKVEITNFTEAQPRYKEIIVNVKGEEYMDFKIWIGCPSRPTCFANRNTGRIHTSAPLWCSSEAEEFDVEVKQEISIDRLLIRTVTVVNTPTPLFG